MQGNDAPGLSDCSYASYGARKRKAPDMLSSCASAGPVAERQGLLAEPQALADAR
jgi:hypothetical protein